MNADIKKLWIEALRSGKYQQGKGFLARMQSDKMYVYCPLGVLCDLACRANVVDSRLVYYGPAQSWIRVFGVERSMKWLPHEVVTWAELPSRSPFLVYDDGLMSIAMLNDARWPSLPFVRIANLLESQDPQ